MIVFCPPTRIKRRSLSPYSNRHSGDSDATSSFSDSRRHWLKSCIGRVLQQRISEVIMSFNVVTRQAGSASATRITRRSTLALMLAIAAVASIDACASGHSHRGGDGQGRMLVHLTNDLAPPSDVTVYAVTHDGIRRVLGDVAPNDQRCYASLPTSRRVRATTCLPIADWDDRWCPNRSPRR